jgi:hypothetical protein
MILCPLLLLLIALAGPAAAQQRAVVVPADASVVVPARGAGPVVSSSLPQRPRRAIGERVLPPIQPAETGTSSLLVSVPLGIAAGVLAAALGGGGGGGSGGGVSAPVRTR